MNKIKTILLTAMLTLGLASCGQKGSSSPAHVHAYDEGVVTTVATCSEKGVKTFTCECGDSYTEEIAVDPNNHVHTETVHTVATLDTAAYDTVTCSACGTTSKENEDVYTASGIVQIYADVVFEDGSDKVKSAALKDGTPVRYTGANFGDSLGNPEEAIGIIDEELFSQLEGLDVVVPITSDEEGGYYIVYKYESDYTFIAVQVNSFVADDNVSTVVQVMTYLVDAK